MTVHGSRADAGAPGDLVKRDGEAVAGEQLAGGGQDTIAVSAGVSAEALALRSA